ncbi:hypothetical protein, partial [Duncaniella muris]|uniref:hypothetical protein n=1 Tax=Duncaniella muris TaxID=2094150 RepID=UPI0025AF2843
GTPYGADLNNHSELTRRGFRIRGGFASFMDRPTQNCGRCRPSQAVQYRRKSRYCVESCLSVAY